MNMDSFEVIELIGQGTYGRVYKVRRRSDGLVLVLKTIPFDGMPPQEQQETLNEAKVMSHIEHSAFIKYYDSFLEHGVLNIVMEFAPGGDLAKKLADRRQRNMGPFDEETLWRFLVQICQGLKYLHEKRILHRDLKAANIFVDAAGRLKIGDLGLGRILGSRSAHARTGVGTPLYFSPELCEDMPYDEKSDIWALGCMLYELATFTPPFIASNQIALAKKIVSEQPAELPPQFSTEFRFLVSKMLEKNCIRRPDINQILAYSPVRKKMELFYLEGREGELVAEYSQRVTAIQSMQLKLEEQRKVWYASHQAEKQQLMAANQDLQQRTQELESQLGVVQQQLRHSEAARLQEGEAAARAMKEAQAWQQQAEAWRLQCDQQRKELQEALTDVASLQRHLATPSAATAEQPHEYDPRCFADSDHSDSVAGEQNEPHTHWANHSHGESAASAATAAVGTNLQPRHLPRRHPPLNPLGGLLVGPSVAQLKQNKQTLLTVKSDTALLVHRDKNQTSPPPQQRHNKTPRSSSHKSAALSVAVAVAARPMSTPAKKGAVIIHSTSSPHSSASRPDRGSLKQKVKSSSPVVTVSPASRLSRGVVHTPPVYGTSASLLRSRSPSVVSDYSEKKSTERSRKSSISHSPSSRSLSARSTSRRIETKHKAKAVVHSLTPGPSRSQTHFSPYQHQSKSKSATSSPHRRVLHPPSSARVATKRAPNGWPLNQHQLVKLLHEAQSYHGVPDSDRLSTGTSKREVYHALTRELSTPPSVRFDSPEHGIRATRRALLLT